jgi:ketosteroid isomerase-like protein
MSDETERELRELEGELVGAVLRRDSSALRRILSDDLTFVTPFGDVFDKAAVADIGDNTDLVNDSIEIDDVRVRVYGEAAVVTGRAALKARVKDLDLSGQYRYVRVYARQEGRWQVVAYQATRIAVEA